MRTAAPGASQSSVSGIGREAESAHIDEAISTLGSEDDGEERTFEAESATSAAASPAWRSLAQTSVPDPFAFLTAVAQPLFAAKDACVRFVTRTTAPLPSLSAGSSEAPAAAVDADADALTRIEREASVIERSFATEFATLVDRSSSETALSDAASVRHQAQKIVKPVDELAARNAKARSPLLAEDDSLEATFAARLETDANRIVLRSSSPLAERAVPLTRLPLRPQDEITWTTESADCHFDGDLLREQRHALLERSVRDASALSDATLARAYREEDLEGRIIALRALCRQFPAQGRAIFLEALRLGSDDERALAIDGLTSIGARAELVPALGDRVDAVAAKAALAFVGMRSRVEYRAELAAYVDAAQIDRILTLLAGIIE